MVRAVAETRGELVVTWDQPTYLNAPTVNYTVAYYRTTSSERVLQMTGPDQLGATISNLLPFTNYSITVQACSEAGCGLESDTVIQLTLEEGVRTVDPLSHALYTNNSNWTDQLKESGGLFSL